MVLIELMLVALMVIISYSIRDLMMLTIHLSSSDEDFKDTLRAIDKKTDSEIMQLVMCLSIFLQCICINLGVLS